MNKHTCQKPFYITFKHIKELKAIQVFFFFPNVTKMFLLLFFQARTVFVFSFSLSAVMSLLKKGLLKWIFQGGNREIVFKEVQLVPNLHSETNHTQKWLMQKKERKSETGFQLIYASILSASLGERGRGNDLMAGARGKKVNWTSGTHWIWTPLKDEWVGNMNAISNTNI